MTLNVTELVEKAKKNDQTAIDKLKSHAHDGSKPDSTALNALAICYEHGYTVIKNHRKAISLYQYAAKLNNPYSMYNLGLLYLKTDLNKAISWFLKTIKNRNNDLTPASHAFIELEELTNDSKPHPSALLSLGKCFEYGWVVNQDYGKAFKLYQQAANLGNVKAKYRIATLYQHGKGVPQNSVTASQLYFEIVKEQHKSNTKISTLALEQLQQLANNRLADSSIFNDLGNCYYLGYCDGSPNYEKAIYFFKLGVLGGNQSCMHHLGEIYRFGSGVESNPSTAGNWFYQAAQSKNGSRSLDNCAESFKSLIELEKENPTNLDIINYILLCYENGYGTKKDAVKSREYILKKEAILFDEWVRNGTKLPDFTDLIKKINEQHAIVFNHDIQSLKVRRENLNATIRSSTYPAQEREAKRVEIDNLNYLISVLELANNSNHFLDTRIPSYFEEKTFTKYIDKLKNNNVYSLELNHLMLWLERTKYINQYLKQLHAALSNLNKRILSQEFFISDWFQGWIKGVPFHIEKIKQNLNSALSFAFSVNQSPDSIKNLINNFNKIIDTLSNLPYRSSRHPSTTEFYNQALTALVQAKMHLPGISPLILELDEQKIQNLLSQQEPLKFTTLTDEIKNLSRHAYLNSSSLMDAPIFSNNHQILSDNAISTPIIQSVQTKNLLTADWLQDQTLELEKTQQPPLITTTELTQNGDETKETKITQDGMQVGVKAKDEEELTTLAQQFPLVSSAPLTSSAHPAGLFAQNKNEELGTSSSAHTAKQALAV